MSTRRWLAIFFVMVSCIAMEPAFPATQNAVVYGTVYDAAGSPMPGVSVQLENAALGFSRSTVTGSDGSYNFAEVPPADDYKLTASKDGKNLDIRSGISVNVGDERVILPPLKEQATAATAEVVEQRAGGQAVRNETVSTTMSGVITGDQLRSLPLYNRNFLALGLVTPNARDTEAGSELQGASFSISGTRPATNTFLLDGADNVASSSNQAVPFQVNDAIQEFRVISSAASAEYGRNQGGVVNVVTRRAGNSFHGSAFGYFGSDAFNSDSPLSVYNGTTFDQAAAFAGSVTAAPLTVPTSVGFAPLTYNTFVATAELNGFCTDGLPLACNNTRFDPATLLAANDRRKRSFDSQQFGVNAGGALVKDKLFAFASYEGTRIDNPNPVFERVPSTFDKTFDPLGAGYTFGSGLGANDPDFRLGQDILALFPSANVVGVPGVLEFFQGEAPNYTRVHNFLGRLDYAQSEKASWTLRYVAQKLNQLHDATLPATGTYPGNGALRDAFNQNLNISYSHSFSPTVINELKGGFNRFNVEDMPQDSSFDATTLGVAGFNFPNGAMPTVLLSGLDTQYSGAVPGVLGAFSGWGDFAIFGATVMAPTIDYRFPFARLGAPLSAPSQRRDTTLFIADNVSWSVGRHSLKFGGEFRHFRNDVFNNVFSRGLMYSSNIGQFTSDSESCNELCAFIFGVSDAFQRPAFDFFQTQPDPYAGRFRSYAVAGYFQDTWRFHSRWTLNYGVRYEYFSPPEEHGDNIWNFDPRAFGLVQQGRLGPVTDPYGNTCGSVLPTYQSVPLANTPAFGILPGPWNCLTTGSGRIVNSDTNNLAPRAGLAWDVWGNGKTVFRFGIGWYYDQLPTSFVSQLMFNRPTASNTLFGRIAFDTFTLCRTSLSCAIGNSVVNPAVQAAVAPDPFGFGFGFLNSDYSVATQPWAIYARDFEHSNTPYTRQMSASVQQQLTNNLTLETAYVGTSGKQLPVVFNSNYQNEFTTFEFGSGFTPNQTAGNMIFFPVFTMTNQAESSYHSMMIRLRAADWHGLRLNATYSLANSEDNASTGFFPTIPSTLNNFGVGYQRGLTFNFAILCLLGTAPTVCQDNPLVFPGIDFSSGAVTTTGAGQILVSRYLIPQNPFDFLRDERGRSDFHTQHRFVLDYTWEIPSLSKAWGWPTWMDNWQVSGIFVAQSGQPFSIFAGPILGEITQRATVTGPVAVSSNPNGAIDPSNLVLPLSNCIALRATIPGIVSPLQPALGEACTGNSLRNAFTGPNFINFDLAVQKGFAIGEGKMLTFRGEFYNLTNRANFYNPISNLSADGATLNADFGKIKSARDSRQIQFAVRFNW